MGSTGSSAGSGSWDAASSEATKDLIKVNKDEMIDMNMIDVNPRDQIDPEATMEMEDDGWNDITCFCNKPYAGKPMIECTGCLTWVHIKCAKMKPDKIPDNWTRKSSVHRTERVWTSENLYSRAYSISSKFKILK